MEQRRGAWIYCAIDAPDDTHDTLKEQFKQLIDYADQMELEVVGSSSDVGAKPLWERNGFRQFVSQVQKGSVKVLLIMNRNCLSRSSMQLARVQILQESHGVRVYSPMEGEIKTLLYERAMEQYQSMEIQSQPYYAEQMAEILCRGGKQEQFNEGCFQKTVEKIMVFKNGTMDVHMRNGVIIQIKENGEEGSSDAGKCKKEHICHTGKASL